MPNITTSTTNVVQRPRHAPSSRSCPFTPEARRDRARARAARVQRSGPAADRLLNRERRRVRNGCDRRAGHEVDLHASLQGLAGGRRAAPAPGWHGAPEHLAARGPGGALPGSAGHRPALGRELDAQRFERCLAPRLEGGANQLDVALEPARHGGVRRRVDRQDGRFAHRVVAVLVKDVLVGMLALHARAECALERRADAPQRVAAQRGAEAVRRLDALPVAAERSTNTWAAPPASAARNGTPPERPASMKRRPPSSTGGPASSGRHAVARRASRSVRSSATWSCRSTGSPVSTSVAIGWSSVGADNTASK